MRVGYKSESTNQVKKTIVSLFDFNFNMQEFYRQCELNKIEDEQSIAFIKHMRAAVDKYLGGE